MEIVVVRTGGRQHKGWVTRVDGSSVFVPIADYGARLPHDLVHHAVEVELDLRWGFWGLLAAGAEFEALARSTARDPRSVPPPDDALVAAHRDELLDAERLVACFSAVLGDEPASEVEGSGLADERVDAVMFAVLDLDRRWRSTAVDDRLALSWREDE